EVFLGSLASARLCPEGLPIVPQACGSPASRRIFLSRHPTHLDRDFHPPAVLSLLRPPIAQTPNPRNRTVHLLSLAYASRPPLGGRLPRGGLPSPRTLWSFGAQVFPLRSRSSCRHSRSRLVQPPSRSASPLRRNAPLPLRRSPAASRSVGGVLS